MTNSCSNGTHRYDGVVNRRPWLLALVSMLVLSILGFSGYEIHQQETGRPANGDTYLACKKFQDADAGRQLSEIAIPKNLQEVIALGLKSNNSGIKDAARSLSKETNHANSGKIFIATLDFIQACNKIGLGPPVTPK